MTRFNNIFRFLAVAAISVLSLSSTSADPIRDNAIGFRNFYKASEHIVNRFDNSVDMATLYEHAWNNLYKRSKDSFPELLAPQSPIVSATYSIHSSSDAIRSVYATKIQKLMNEVTATQTEDATPTVRDMWAWASFGLVRGLEDPYSQFLPPREHEKLRQDLSGEPSKENEFYGVGISVDWDTENDMGVLVITPLPGTPAERNGIEAGDVIVAVNGEVLRNFDGAYSDKLDNAINLITGEEGTEVTLSIKKPNVPEPVDITVERAPINREQQISKEMLTDTIGRITLSSFYAHATEDLVEAMRYLKTEGMEKLILDFRWNPGGYLDQAVKIAEVFLEKGSLVTYTEGRESPKTEFIDESNGTDGFTDIPMAILLNQWSASASEVVTGALRDNERAVVVGKTSFGKGSVQEVFPLIDGAGLRLTVARYFTPSGVCIHEIGIEPDIAVESVAERIQNEYDEEEKIEEEMKSFMEKDYSNYSRLERLYDRDPQLEAAVKYLSGEITVNIENTEAKTLAGG